MNRVETKIFFIVWIIYAFHGHWVGWAEHSLLDLTMASSNEKRFEIDSYHNNTGDRAFYNGHYYANKNPGAAFLNIFPYSALKFWYSVLPLPKQYDAPVWRTELKTVTGHGESVMVFVVNPGTFYQFAQLFSIVFTTSFISALSVVLMYKLARRMRVDEHRSKLLCVAFGLGTMVFPFATNFFQHAFGMFFGLLAFYCLFTDGKKRIYHFLAGISLGLAVTSDGNFFYLVIPFFVYSSIKFRSIRSLAVLLSGIIVAAAPLMVYNYAIFSDFFKNTYTYSDLTVRNDIQEGFGFHLPNPFIIYRHTFDTYRGIFMFNPILILSVLGFPFMLKKLRTEAIFIVLFYASQLIFYSSFNTDFTFGASFGPRQYLPSVPFLFLPLIFFLKRQTSVKVFMIFLLLSIFINSVLSNYNWETALIDTSKPTLLLKTEYQEKAERLLEPLFNPIKEYYMPTFFQYGFSSRVIDGIFNHNINLKLYNPTFSVSGLVFLSLALLLWYPFRRKEPEAFHGKT